MDITAGGQVLGNARILTEAAVTSSLPPKLDMDAEDGRLYTALPAGAGPVPESAGYWEDDE